MGKPDMLCVTQIHVHIGPQGKRDMRSQNAHPIAPVAVVAHCNPLLRHSFFKYAG